MRLFIVAIAVTAMIGASPAAAQETTPDPGRDHRMELAARYLDLTQGRAMVKVVTRQVEREFGGADMPADQRAWLVENLPPAFAEMMEATSADMRDDVAELFTARQLEAAIAFYETPEGQAVAQNNVELGVRMQEIMLPHMVATMTKLQEKFCGRFDCSQMAATAAKPQD